MSTPHLLWPAPDEGATGVEAYTAHVRAVVGAALPEARIELVPLRRRHARVARAATAVRHRVPWSATAWEAPRRSGGRGVTVVADHLRTGRAALAMLRAGVADRLLYVSHNQEAALRRQVVESERHAVRRGARVVDFRLTDALERQLLAAASLVVAITPHDASAVARRTSAPVVVVPPPLPALAPTDAGGGRGVAVVGSTDWSVKERNQLTLLAALASEPSLADVPIRLLGRHRSHFVREARRLLPRLDVAGFVPDLVAAIAECAVFTFDDTVGGGFQMKLLDGLAAGRPVVATVASLRGLERPNCYPLAEPDVAAVARTIGRCVTDADLRRQGAAALQAQLSWLGAHDGATREIADVVRGWRA